MSNSKLTNIECRICRMFLNRAVQETLGKNHHSLIVNHLFDIPFNFCTAHQSNFFHQLKTLMSTKNEFIKHISQHDFAEVCQNTQTGQHLLRSSISFKPDAVICPFSAGETLDEPTYLTIQVADNQHITLKPEFLQFTNHSCSPNAFFNTTTMQFICLKQIVVGDEITFFYPSSEWDMTQSFACHCGTPECLHQIQGAFYLPFSDLKKYRLTDFIRLKIKQEAAAL